MSWKVKKDELSLEVIGEQFHDCCSFLAVKKTSLGKVLGSGCRLQLLLFIGAFMSKSLERQSFELELQSTSLTLGTAMIFAPWMSLGLESRGVMFETELETEPSMMWLLMFEKNLTTNLTIFKTMVMVSLDPALPCSTKLLFTELVKNLAS